MQNTLGRLSALTPNAVISAWERQQNVCDWMCAKHAAWRETLTRRQVSTGMTGRPQ